MFTVTVSRLARVAAALAMAGCSAVSYAPIRTPQSPQDLLITQQSLREPYESKGVVQLTRKGVLLFGFADIPGTNLEAAVDEIAPEVRRRGGDALVNVRIEQTQYTTAQRIFGAIFFFVPLPSEVTINGEVVRRGAVVEPAPTPAAGGGS
ncbi:MAG: hypothetical protein FJ096_11585 [Deltaproteobacteria bacterium]|nr:hypothetical protein [Deltaproteobacteria bacterium]